jgi:hypothetical protein
MASNDITTFLARAVGQSGTASNFTPIIVDFSGQDWPTKIVATNEGDQSKPPERSHDDRFLCLE